MKKKKLLISKKQKITLNSIKEKIIKIVKESILLVQENRFIFCFILGNTLNGLLLRILTIGNWYSLAPLLADFLISIIVGSFAFLFKKKRNKNIYIFAMTALSVLLCISNVVYYIYYSSFISITFISFALTNTETGNANVLGDLLQPKTFLSFLLLIFMILVRIFVKDKKTRTVTNKKLIFCNLYSWVLVVLLLFLCLLKPIDYSRFYKQWNREYLVSRFGLYLYQVNDVVKSIEPKMASMFGSDKATKKINDYYSENSKEKTTNKYTDIFKGKNVIAIHAESIQNIIGLEINGQQVAPNLTKLAKNGLYFSNFYSQVSFGTSSDTEFTLATSLLPVSNGTVAINYSDREYESMYKELKQDGYYIFSMHANTGDFWNRNLLHKALGYDYFYDKSEYEIDETIGFGLSDRSFMLQSVDMIEQIASEHENFYGTLLTLSNHTPFEYDELFGEFDVSMTIDGVTYPYLEGTKLGNYFKSVHYADAQIGLLVEELENRGLLDNTIIVIYGDHDARISKSEWSRLYNYDYTTDSLYDESDPRYTNLDYYWQEMNRKVPFIIYSNDTNFQKNYSKEVKDVMGMVDVAPTLGNMMGFNNKYALGNDIFNIKDKNIVVFANGNYVTNYVFYNDNKEEYKVLTNNAIEDNYVEECKNYSEEVLDISNDIIVYNYFKKLNSTTKYEVESNEK